MSLGDRLRGWIDPLDPAVRTWLQRELPRLVNEGYIDVAQADLIARRYGVTVTTADIAAATAQAAPAQPIAPAAPGPLPDGAAAPASSSLPADTDPVIGTIGAAAVGPGQWTTASVPESQAAQPDGPPIGQPGDSPFASPAAGASPMPPGRPSTPFIADHAVSIVLYLGAFLVVASVIIFLAYSWEDMSGGARLSVLGVLTAGFLAAAAFCLPRPAVRPAGRTFLALGAILVPANVASVYLVYFWDSPIPPAVFWLLGGLISGALHAVLSVRLRSYGYAVLAMPSVPVAASALGWLIEPSWPWLGTSSALALAVMLAVARDAPPIPLVQTARVVGSGMLALAFVATLPALSERGLGQLSTPVALMLMTLGLAWDATRRGKTWWFGALAALGTAPLIAIALTVEDRRYWFVDAIMVSGWIAALVAWRLETRTQRLLWACAALLPAAVYPIVTWEDDRASVQLFVSLIVLAGAMVWLQKSVLPLYLGVLAVDGAYIKLLDIYGSPDSPAWALGVALWPVAIVWAVIGMLAPRRLSGPTWFAALVTMVAAVLITRNEPSWNLAITASAAVATVVAAWRLRVAALVPLAGIWLMVAGYQGADLLQLAMPWRYVMVGLTAWLLFAVSLARPPGWRDARPEPAVEPAANSSDEAADPATQSAASAALPADTSLSAADATDQVTATPGDSAADAVPGPGRASPLQPAPLPPLTDSTVGEWALAARVGALAVAGLAILLLLGVLRSNDPWLEASIVSWLNVVLLLAGWALISRSWLLALVAALAMAPALLSGIARLHPPDPQYFAAPVGVYLLAVGTVARVRRQPLLGSIIAGVGLVALLGTSVIQSFERDGFRYALIALAEGLLLVGIGIAVRWRVVVACGVAGTVVIALRQLFDAVSALPGWAILGGSGILLLGIAVALLVIRARLAAAGRAVAERWSQWD